MIITTNDQIHGAGIPYDLAIHNLLVHELRSPLTVVAGRLQLIRTRQLHGAILPSWLDAELNAIELATNWLVELVAWDPTPPPHDHAD